jgi:phage anti-repressor protein
MGNFPSIIKHKFDGKTEQAVSVRDLYEKLDLHPNHFAKWCKLNIEETMENGKEWIFHTQGEKRRGRPTKDYIVTLNAAKHLAMLARTDAGKAIRQYFIEAEKALQTISGVSEELMNDPIIAIRISQIQVEKRLNTVEDKLANIELEKVCLQEELIKLPAPTTEAPTRTPRSYVNEVVRAYVVGKHGGGKEYKDAWARLFTECNYRLNINLTRLANETGKPKLDILEEKGLINDVHAIAVSIFNTRHHVE